MKLMLLFALISVSSLFSCTVQRSDAPVPEENEKSGRPVRLRQPVLVELFTSEGCSSCPPADRQLAFLENKQPVPAAEVITLAFHVDYWDDLGWRDAFSSAEFSERQNSYVQRMKLNSSYTPQMVVDGVAEFVGSDASRANQTITEAAERSKANIDLHLRETKVEIEITNIQVHDAATVYLAIAEDNIVTDVRKGENAGRKLPHVSVVRKLVSIGQIKPGESKFSAAVENQFDPEWKRENLKYVVFAQENASGRIFAVGKTKAGN